MITQSHRFIGKESAGLSSAGCEFHRSAAGPQVWRSGFRAGVRPEVGDSPEIVGPRVTRLLTGKQSPLLPSPQSFTKKYVLTLASRRMSLRNC